MTLVLLGPKAKPQPLAFPLIPRPAAFVWEPGKSCRIGANYRLVAEPGMESAAAALRATFARASSGAGPVVKVVVKRNPKLVPLGPEGYSLTIAANEVRIECLAPAGAFYAAQTIRQLAPTKGPLTLPVGSVVDKPRFSWRGMHLDCSRHFFTVNEVKRYIDYLASLKFNTFHWHLIDEGGWRMEVKRYPKLTEVGAFRTVTPEVWGGKLEFPGPSAGKRLYGGYYKQSEIRDVVAYAKRRMIQIIPEIEMPGHILPAIWAYPELGCDVKGQPPGAGFPTYAYCVGKASTHQFIQNVLKETMELFPSKVIHVGGDEVNQSQWLNCPDCSQYMQQHGLKDGRELQSDFMKRTERYLNAHGRTLMGWDEILDGGLAPKAMVMSWRGVNGGIEAAHGGHDVVMSPTSHCYFDYPYATIPTEKVYDFDPVPWELKDESEGKIKGGQANVWTEWIPNFKRVEYMIFPRVFAMSESLWTQKEMKSWNDFLPRLNQQYARLVDQGIQFYIAPPTTDVNLVTLDGKAKVAFNFPPVPGLQPKYRLDDGPWQNYVGPLTLTKPGIVVAATAQGAKVSDEFETVAVIAKPTTVFSDPTPGMRQTVYQGLFTKTPAPDAQVNPNFPPSRVDSIDFAPFKSEKSFALRLDGFFRVERAGMYTWTLGSDDGSRLSIGGGLVIDNDRLQSYSERVGRAILAPGIYPVEVVYFDGGGGRALRMFVEGPGQPRRELQPRDFFLRSDR